MCGNLSDAIDAVSIYDILEEFDVVYQRKGSRTYIICPAHDDHNLGSCVITKSEQGYCCFACHTYENKFNMVKRLGNYTGKETAEWFFSKSGIKPFDFTPDDEYVVQAKVKRMLAEMFPGMQQELLEVFKSNPKMLVTLVRNATAQQITVLKDIGKCCADDEKISKAADNLIIDREHSLTDLVDFLEAVSQ